MVKEWRSEGGKQKKVKESERKKETTKETKNVKMHWTMTE